MFKIISILFLVGFCSCNSASSIPDGYQGLMWGSNSVEVSNKFSGAKIVQEQDESGIYKVFFLGKVDFGEGAPDVNRLDLYVGIVDGLRNAKIIFFKPNDQQIEFLKKTISSKYGNGVVVSGDSTIWKYGNKSKVTFSTTTDFEMNEYDIDGNLVPQKHKNYAVNYEPDISKVQF